MKTRWRRLRQSIEYAAVRGALWAAGVLPIRVSSAMGAVAGYSAFALGIRRDVSVDNIVRALGASPAEARSIARASYANLGRLLMEFAVFRRVDDDDLRAMVDFEGLENLEPVRAAGRGAILTAGHFGHWELLGAGLRAHGNPIDFLVGQQTNERIDEVINDLRRRVGIGIITRTSALRKVLQALREGRFVALLVDQDARKGGVMVDFLGRPASTVRGPALFAIRSGCAVVPIFIFREGGRHRGIVEKALYPDPALDEEAAVLDLTRRYTDRLSYHVRRHPRDYFWPHRRWKTYIGS